MREPAEEGPKKHTSGTCWKFTLFFYIVFINTPQCRQSACNKQPCRSNAHRKSRSSPTRSGWHATMRPRRPGRPSTMSNGGSTNSPTPLHRDKLYWTRVVFRTQWEGPKRRTQSDPRGRLMHIGCDAKKPIETTRGRTTGCTEPDVGRMVGSRPRVASYHLSALRCCKDTARNKKATISTCPLWPGRGLWGQV